MAVKQKPEVTPVALWKRIDDMAALAKCETRSGKAMKLAVAGLVADYFGLAPGPERAAWVEFFNTTPPPFGCNASQFHQDRDRKNTPASMASYLAQV